jgi:hypothetical protein
MEVMQQSVIYLPETIRTRDDALQLASEYMQFNVTPDEIYVIL